MHWGSPSIIIIISSLQFSFYSIKSQQQSGALYYKVIQIRPQQSDGPLWAGTWWQWEQKTPFQQEETGKLREGQPVRTSQMKPGVSSSFIYIAANHSSGQLKINWHELFSHGDQHRPCSRKLTGQRHLDVRSSITGVQGCTYEKVQFNRDELRDYLDFFAAL